MCDVEWEMLDKGGDAGCGGGVWHYTRAKVEQSIQLREGRGVYYTGGCMSSRQRQAQVMEPLSHRRQQKYGQKHDVVSDVPMDAVQPLSSPCSPAPA